MKHVRIFANVFGIHYCIKGIDLPVAQVEPLVIAFNVVAAKFPVLTIEVTDRK